MYRSTVKALNMATAEKESMKKTKTTGAGLTAKTVAKTKPSKGGEDGKMLENLDDDDMYI